MTLSETAARKLGLHVGDLFEFGSLSQQQADAFLGAGEEPTSLDGPQLSLRVVGIARTGFDLNSLGQGTALTMTTPAFWDKYGTAIGVGSRSHMVRLVDEPGAVDQFTAAVAAAYEGQHLPSINIGQGETAVADSISVVTARYWPWRWWSPSPGSCGSVRRLGAINESRHRTSTWCALGTTAGERRLLVLGCVLPGLLGGLILAPIVAGALSPAFPVGTARKVDPDPGLHADAATLVVGSVALLAVLAIIAVLAGARLVSEGSALRTKRDPRAPTRRSRRSRPSTGPGTGVRFALSAPSRGVRSGSPCACRCSRGSRRPRCCSRRRSQPATPRGCACPLGHHVGRRGACRSVRSRRKRSDRRSPQNQTARHSSPTPTSKLLRSCSTTSS